MATEQKLIIELIRAKMINAKREKEASERGLELKIKAGAVNEIPEPVAFWEGQEIAFRQLLNILGEC